MSVVFSVFVSRVDGFGKQLESADHFGFDLPRKSN
jgi:hypothetical protein